MKPETTPTNETSAAFAARLWRYQGERFPLANHGVLTLAFAASACAFAAALSGEAPSPLAIALATVAGLCQFALLRIADEHKDYDTDLKHRPYRAVPRGLVTLAELRLVGFVAVGVMIAAVALAASGGLALLALALWTYFALMSAEFFIAETLKRMPVAYLLSHMVIMPLIAWMLAAFQLVADGLPVQALPERAGAFLVSVFALGIVLELGRKIRATADEEPGVETYSMLWGPIRARAAWAFAVLVADGAMIVAVMQVSGSLVVAFLSGTLGIAAAALLANRFDPARPGSGKMMEHASSAAALAFLLAFGLAPHIQGLP